MPQYRAVQFGKEHWIRRKPSGFDRFIFKPYWELHKGLEIGIDCRVPIKIDSSLDQLSTRKLMLTYLSPTHEEVLKLIEISKYRLEILSLVDFKPCRGRVELELPELKYFYFEALEGNLRTLTHFKVVGKFKTWELDRSVGYPLLKWRNNYE